MTLQEFKAWFDGFTEGFDGKTPTTKQWQRIQKRVKEIDGAPVTERVFIDRYWPYPHQWYGYTKTYTAGIGLGAVGNYYNAANTANLTGATAPPVAQNAKFSPINAMYSLGVAESKSND